MDVSVDWFDRAAMRWADERATRKSGEKSR
jgi:hypothetical protein